jgi:uncharacterized hydrophobic protein (TIGR00271 family)
MTILQPFSKFLKTIEPLWTIHFEQRVPAEELANSRTAGSIPSFGFFFLLTLASIIATLGLITNSSAVIIGAMIVAPLMNPILSISFAIATANWALFLRSGLTTVLGSFLAIGVASLVTALSPWDVVGSELLSRTRPTILDLGIAIAAGAAGAFSLTRMSIASSIAGVAIAVALVPPLCVVGIGLAGGSTMTGVFGNFYVTNLDVAGGASLLFLANLIGITISACLVFVLQSYGSLRKALKSLVLGLLAALMLSRPLGTSLHEFAVDNRVQRELYGLHRDGQYRDINLIHRVDTKLVNGVAYVNIVGAANEEFISDQRNMDNLDQRIFNAIQSMGVHTMHITIRITPIEIFEYSNTSSSYPYQS